MSVEENKAIVKKFLEKPDKSDEELREMHTPDFVHHWHGGVRNYDEWHELVVRRRQSVGGSPRLTVDDMIAEGDRVAVWATIKKEGREDRYGSFVYRLSGGKIAESWNMISIQSGSFGLLPHE